MIEGIAASPRHQPSTAPDTRMGRAKLLHFISIIVSIILLSGCTSPEVVPVGKVGVPLLPQYNKNEQIIEMNF